MATDSMGYSDTVLAHFRAPRNAGSFPAGTANVSQGSAGERRRGREIHLELKLTDDGRVEAMRY
ncbi:MAG TPA: iron-sulfur cluster assembly scaffold protein, partial [Gammaproteobacteria bacterium]